MDDNILSRPTGKVTTLLVAGMLLTACVTNPIIPQDSSSSTSQAGKQMRSDSAYFNRSGVEACLVAGGVSALIMHLIEKDSKKTVAAAVVGCGVGVGANHYMQQRRQQYANNEQRLQTMIADVRADNQRLGRIIQSADEVVKEDRNKIEEIDRAYKQKSMTLEQAKAEMKSVDENKAYLEQTLANLKKREAEWVEVASAERKTQSKQSMAAMDSEIQQLQNQIASLESDLEILVNRRSVSPIG